MGKTAGGMLPRVGPSAGDKDDDDEDGEEETHSKARAVHR